MILLITPGIDQTNHGDEHGDNDQTNNKRIHFIVFYIFIRFIQVKIEKRQQGYEPADAVAPAAEIGTQQEIVKAQDQ